MPPDHPPTVRPNAGRGSLWLDLLSGYALTAARIAAWAGVSALVYRGPHPSQFALLVLLRGTITLVGYTSLGIGPAMVRLLTTANPARPPNAADPGTAAGNTALPLAAVPIPVGPAADVLPPAGDQPAGSAPALDYQGPPAAPSSAATRRAVLTPEQRVFASGACLAVLLGAAAVVATLLYASLVDRVHVLPPVHAAAAGGLVVALGLGTALRIVSEPASAALQAGGHLAVDNYLAAGAELSWLALMVLRYGSADAGSVGTVGQYYLLASLGLLAARVLAAAALVPATRVGITDAAAAHVRAILAFGAGVLVAQLADFLYAPMSYVVINRLLTPGDLVAYAPAVQIDGALLVLVGGLAAVVFPRAAAAHAAGDLAAVRRYYLRGTAAAAAVLAAAAVPTALLADRLLVAWLGEDLPQTRAILPLVLVHTVVGGSAAVGRSVLLGMGRVRALTASAVVAGAANVVLGIVLAAGLGLGLRGIVLGTVIVVVARAGIWMPWYVLRALKRESGSIR